MEKTVSTDKARQGRLGRPVLVILVVALLLAIAVWAGLEMWGEQIDSTASDDASGASTDAN